MISALGATDDFKAEMQTAPFLTWQVDETNATSRQAWKKPTMGLFPGSVGGSRQS